MFFFWLGLQGVSSKAAAVKATPTTSANCDASVCVLSSTFGADPVATAVTPVKLSITTTAFFIPKFRPFNGPWVQSYRKIPWIGLLIENFSIIF